MIMLLKYCLVFVELFMTSDIAFVKMFLIFINAIYQNIWSTDCEIHICTIKKFAIHAVLHFLINF